VSPGQYTEDQLVEQPAIELFKELGWDSVNAYYETLGPEGSPTYTTDAQISLGSSTAFHSSLSN
jgi:type I restriction enzyme R subunit